jgi:hypothetical protein
MGYSGSVIICIGGYASVGRPELDEKAGGGFWTKDGVNAMVRDLCSKLSDQIWEAG